jgi:hypothetical protein
VGSKEMLKSFIKAFDLDDRHRMIENDYKDLGFKYFGVRIFNAMMFIIGASAFFMNYFSGLYVLFPALVLLSGIIGVKYHFIRKINVYEILILIFYLSVSISSIWVDFINKDSQDQIILIPISVLLLCSVIFNRPIVFKYLKYDYTREYIHTKLFTATANGISFIWGFIYLIILFGPFFSGEEYVSVYYYFIFIGMLMTYYYPSIYIKTSIKKS